MLLSKLGEFGLIERLKKSIRLDSSVVKGTGDDCAVLKYTREKYQLFTCDMLVEGVDFSSQDKPQLIGRKALAVSLSDIAACAGIPRYCLVSLGIPKETTVEFMDDFLKGMRRLADKYRLNLVGGDLSKAKHLTIDVSVLGVVEKRYLVLRSGAERGDIIFVTGKFGGSICRRHLKFTPRLEEARFLVKNFKVKAMIDVSDGLTQDLNHILEESGVGAIIYTELIPLSKDARGLEDALYSGEDFELLFTLSAREAKKLIRRKLAIFQPIGEILEKKYSLRLVDKKGRERIISARGFRHF